MPDPAAPPNTIRLVNPRTGESLVVDSPEKADLLAGAGYQRADVSSQVGAQAREGERQYYTTGYQPLKTFVESAGRGATFGLIGGGDEADRRAMYNPGTAMTGELTGAGVAAIASGGDSLLGTAARATPVGQLSRLAGAAGEALADSRVAQAAITGAIEGGGQLAGTQLVQELTNRADTPEHVIQELGLGTLLGMGLGALGGAMGGSIEGAAARAQAKVAAGADEAVARLGAGGADVYGPSRRLVDDFMQRGDIPVRLGRVEAGFAAARKDAAHAVDLADKQVENIAAQLRVAHDAHVAGQAAHDAEYAATGVERYAPEMGNYIPDHVQIPKPTPPEVLAQKRMAGAQHFTDLDEHADALGDMLKTADDPAVHDAIKVMYREGEAARKAVLVQGFSDDVPAALKGYKNSVRRVAELSGDADALASVDSLVAPDWTKLEAPGTVKGGKHIESKDTAPYQRGPYVDGEAKTANIRAQQAEGTPTFRENPALEPLRARLAQAENDAKALAKAKQTLEDIGSAPARLHGLSPDEFSAHARNLDAVLSSPAVSQTTKDVLKGSLRDLSEKGFGFGGQKTMLKDLNLVEAARALGLSDDIVAAVRAAPESARALTAGYVAFSGLELAPSIMNKAARGAGGVAGRGARHVQPGFLGRMTEGVVASKAAQMTREATGSWLAGSAVLHSLYNSGMFGFLTGVTGSVTTKITKAIARLGPTGRVLRRVLPTMLGRLTSLELQPVPAAKRKDEGQHYREVLAQWKHLASPEGGSVLTAAVAPFAQQAGGSFATTLQLTAQRIASAVVAHAPQDPGGIFRGLKSTWRPDPVALSKWADYAKVATQGPTSVLEDLADGVLTIGSAQAARELFPETFKQIQAQMIGTMAAFQEKGHELSYQQRILIGNLLGMPADGTLTPKFISSQQEMWAAMRMPVMAGAASSPAGRPSSNQPSAAVTMATKAQQIMTR